MESNEFLSLSEYLENKGAESVLGMVISQSTPPLMKKSLDFQFELVAMILVTKVCFESQDQSVHPRRRAFQFLKTWKRV